MNPIINFKTVDGGTVSFNPSADHRNAGGDARIEMKVRDALLSLKRINVQCLLENWMYAAADTIYDSNIMIAPSYIFGTKEVLHKKIVEYLLEKDNFSAELWEHLEERGAFNFLVTVNNREHSEAQLKKIVCVFGMSALGHHSVENVRPDFIHAVVDWFRTPDSSRWRNFPANNVTQQCLRAVTLGLSEIYEDASLLAKAGNKREYAGRISSWKEFVHSDKPMNVELNELLEDFLENSLTAPANAKGAIIAVGAWLQAKHPGRTFSDVCSVAVQKRGFAEYLEFECNKTGRTLIDLCNITKRITDHFVGVLEERNSGVVYYPFIADSELVRVRNAPVPPKPNAARSRPFPQKLHALAKFILDEPGGWAEKSGLFDERLPSGEIIYCPVIPTLLRNALDIPLRIGQSRRLDSGEGDVRRFNADLMAWEENTGPLAGYWADRDGARHEGYPERGYAHEFKEDAKSLTGFFINTNKTSEPYLIPWEHRDVHARFWKLRKWQEKFNPVKDALTPDQYLDDEKKVSKKTKLRLPDIFPIFRLFPNSARPWPGRIPTTGEMDHAWQAFNAEIQRVWNLDNPSNPIDIVSYDPRFKQACKAKYNLHGMRVRGLTDLYRSGMRPELISKVIAGHATVSMTLYYLESLPGEVDQKLSAAALQSQAAAALETMDYFTKASFDDAKKRVVALQPEAIAAAHEWQDRLLIDSVGIGFCPFSCDPSRCEDGGPILRHSEKKDGTTQHKHAPVPGGRRNCIMCRHFVTAPAWLVPLELYGSKLCEMRRHLALREQEASDRLDALSASRMAKTPEERLVGDDIYRRTWDEQTKHRDSIRDEQEIVETSIFNVEVLLRACAKLLEEQADDDGRLPMVANSSESIVQYIETSDFEHSLLQSMASRIYPVLESQRVEDKRDRFLEMILFDSGIKPPGLMFDVTSEMRRAAMDRFAELLIHRASRAELRALSDGNQSLRDIGVWDDVNKAIESALANKIAIPTQTANFSTRLEFK